jgi:large repetitive protein
MRLTKFIFAIIFLLCIKTAFAQAPNYVWAKRVGGTNIDDGRSIVVDAAGNSYITGFFRQTIDVDPGPGTTLVTSLGLQDVFITKLDAAGNYVWARTFGGVSADYAYSIALDAAGNIYTTGQFAATVDFNPGAGTFNMTSVGSWDAFVLKLDASGNFVWAKQFGSTLSDNGRTINTDAAGNVYTIGFFTGTADFDPGAGVSNLVSAGVDDVFISKLDAAGNFVWAKSIGGTGSDEGRGLVIDAAGNVFISGYYTATVDFDPGVGTNNLTSVGSVDAYLLKLNSSGNFVWAISLGGTLSDASSSIALDGSGNILMVGSFSGTSDFDPGVGTFNLTSAGLSDMYIAKIDPVGNLIWVNRIGSTGDDYSNWVTVDPSGDVYVGTGFSATVDYDPGAGTFNLVSAGGFDIAILKLNAAGNFAWAVRMGGILNEACYSLAYHSSGTIYSTGVFDDVVDFNPGAGTFNLTSAGASEVWIQKLCQLAPQPGAVSGNIAICSGSTNTYSITPVSTAISYTWSTPAGWTGTSTTNSLTTTSSLTSGNVSVVAVNACGTSVARTLSVTVTPTPTFPTVITGNTTVCAGSTNVYSIGFVNGATSYNWTYPAGWTGPAVSTIPSVSTIAGANSGTITVTASNSCGTTAPRTLTVTVTPAITSSVSSQTNILCNGGTNGAATVLPSSGTAPYTYAWSPSGGTAATATGLTAGIYTCTITDAAGCSGTRTVNITQPTALASSVSSQTNISCNAGNNGAATVSVSGGTPGYTYSWAPSGGTAASITGRTFGTYTCTITDANGCTQTQTVSLTQPTVIASSVISQTNISCNSGNNGAATISVSGGTPGYTYSWAPSGGTTASISGRTAGTYTCTITDANSCTRTQTVSLTQPTALVSSVTSQTNVSCNGGNNGAATVSVSGGAPGYTYLWSPSGGTAATASGLISGTYTCTITDANSCTRTQTVSLTQPAGMSSSVTSQTNVLCNGGNNGSASISVSGGAPGYTYSWAPSGGTTASITGRTAGTYTCTITDANSCTRTQTVSLTQPTVIASSVTSQTNISCNGGNNGAATVSVSGGTPGYTYSWAPSGGTAASITGRTFGTYTCTITDANGCTQTQTVSLTQPTVIASSVISQTNISCNSGNNGAATISVSGGIPGYTYSWAPSGGTTASISGRTAGTYTCTITDANSCTRTQTISLTQPTALASSVSSQTNLSCNGGNNGAATVSVSGGTPGYTYSWLPSGGTAATAAGLIAGTYTCTITDANSCTRTQTVSLTQPAGMSSSVTSQTNVLCNGGNNGAASISVSGGAPGYTYSWAPSGGTTASITGRTAGTYTCTITDANSCTRTQTVSLTQPTVIASSVSSQTNVSCNGGNNGAATVSVSGGTPGYTYSWAPSGGTAASITGRTFGTYTCTITDANGCTQTQTVSLTQPTVLASTVSSQTNISCNSGNNGAATVSASGGTPGYTYSWSPSGGTAATAAGLIAGTYTCTITDANSCIRTQTVSLIQPTVLASSVSSQTNLSCNGGNNGAATVSVSGGTPGYTYSWSPSGGTAATAAGLIAGTYTCTITDANSCTRTQTVSLTQPTVLASSVSSQTNLSCNGGNNGAASISVSGGTPGYTYSWSPSGGTAATAAGLIAGTYTCTITDANSCAQTQTVSLTQPAGISSSVASQTNILCNGGSNGAATVNVTGGTPGYTYNWAPSGGTAATESGLSASTYTCTINDANGCTQTQTVIITEPTAITVSIVSQSDVTCFGNADGTATVTENGGVGPYTYNWTPSGGIIATATGLTAGTYTCTVTDANMCTSTQTVNITEPAAITSSQTLTLCDGQTITVGTNTYTVSGVYTDVLSSLTGCDSTITTNLTIEAPIDVTITQTPTSITANQSGATYQWIDCANGNAPINGEVSQTFTPVVNGNYAVIVTVGSCSATSLCSSFVTGITNNQTNLFSIYPNPNNGQFIIELVSVSVVSIVDVTGRVVFTQQLNAGRNTIELGNQSNGVYMVQVVNNGQQTVQRLIIQH